MHQRLTVEMAAGFAGVTLAKISRPYPDKLDHLLTGPEPGAADHVALHPVFFGSYDRHSSVRMHWLLVRLLRLQPQVAGRDQIIATLAGRLTGERVARERAYCNRPGAETFERPYGWAWLLELRAELERLRGSLPQAGDWAGAVDPLACDLAAGLPQTVGGDYVGGHWLASFAALALGDIP